MGNDLLRGKRVLWVGAHPDDESFVAGGTLSTITREGGIADLIVATRGERGRAYVDPAITEEELGAMRAEELREVHAKMEARHLAILDLPDGNLAEHHDGFTQAIIAHATSWESELIMSFGEDGYTGHRDHVAAYRAAREAAQQLGLPLVCAAIPNLHADAFREHLAQKRVHGHYDDFCGSEGIFHQPVDPVLKMELLACYDSQFDGLNPHKIFPAELAEHFLTNEYFTVEGEEVSAS